MVPKMLFGKASITKNKSITNSNGDTIYVVSIVFTAMATPDISTLIKKLNNRKREVLTLNSIKTLNDSSLCEELSFVIRNDQDIRYELDSLQRNLTSLLNSNTFTYEEIEPQNKSFLDIVLTGTNNLNYGVNGAGLVTGSVEHHFYAQKNVFTGHARWRGKNGVWYSTELNPRFYGNQYTGKRVARINNNVGKISTGLFYLSTVISSGHLLYGIYKKDDKKIIKSSADIIIGCVAAYCGPPGWIIGGMYLIMDLAGVFDNNYCGSTYNDPTIAPRDKTYVAPKCPLPFIK